MADLWNHDLEQQILGACLAKPEFIPDLQGLTGKDMHHPANEAIMSCMQAMDKANIKPDITLVHDALQADPHLSAAGGSTYLASLITSVAIITLDHTQQWAAKVHEYSQRRTIIAQAMIMQEQAANMATDIGTTVTATQKEIDKALEAEVINAQAPGDLVFGYMEYLEGLQRRDGSCLKTPFYGLNDKMGGLFAPEVTIVAARPGLGKTAFALNMAEYLGRKGNGAGVFSLEMSSFGLMNRVYADRANVDANIFRSGKFTDADWKAIYAYTDKFSKLPIRIWDKPSLTPMQFRNQCRAWKREMGMKVAIIDYLQLMSADSRGGSREQEVSAVSRSIKKTAMEFEIPIILLSQLNRDADKTNKPLLSQLRESGAIEQDADNIIFICPNKNTDPNSSFCPCEINIAKGRNCGCGSTNLIFDRSHVRFLNPQIANAMDA